MTLMMRLLLFSLKYDHMNLLQTLRFWYVLNVAIYNYQAIIMRGYFTVLD